MKFKKIIASLLIICLCFTFLNIDIFAAEIKISLGKQPNIDIVLAKSKTNTNVSNFEKDIMKALVDRGISKEKVKITAVEATSSSMSEEGAEHILKQWENYPDSTGQWKYDAATNSLGSTQNVSWTGFWNTSEEAKRSEDISIEYKSKEILRVTGQAPMKNFTNVSCHPDPQGFTFRMTHENGTYSYYCFMVYAYQQVAGLYKIVNTPNPNSATSGVVAGFTTLLPTTLGTKNQYATCLAFSDIIYNPLSEHSFKIEATGPKIKITYDGNVLFNISDNNNPLLQGSYGPFTYSTPNACIYDVKVTSQKVKQFTEILNAPEWRDSALHFVVNVEDTTNPSFQTDIEKILSKTINDKINFISWGTTENEDDMKGFIQQNSGNGVFVYNGDYNNAINSTANYIKTFIKEPEQGTQYAIVNEYVNVEVNPSSYKNNTAGGEYPHGRWLIEHNPDVVANPTGQFVNSGNRLNNLNITSFDKPGEYKIKYEENLIKTIIVHRMPVASFTFLTTNNILKIERRNSYDLDSNDDSKGFGRGIKAEEWKYKISNEQTWRNGLPTNLTPGLNYIIQLRVQDYYDQWSDPITKYISGSSEYVNPVADFNFSSPQISKYINNFSITNSSYDPKSLPLNYYHWTVVKDGKTTLYEGGNSSFFVPNINFQENGTGTYTYTLYVQNTANLKSDEYTKFLTVVEDTQKPDIEINPQNGDWASNISSHNISVKLTDTDSKLASYRYAITTSSVQPTQNASNWTGLVNYGNNISTAIQQITVSNQGTWYIHVEAIDKARNRTVVSRGPYKIDTGSPGVEFIKIEDLQEYLPKYKP